MAKNTGTMIFLNWFVIPIVTLILLFVIEASVTEWYIMLLFACIVYFISFVVTAIVRKATGRGVFKSPKDFWVKMLIILFKSFGFAIGLTGMIYLLIADNAVFYVMDYPSIIVDLRYVMIASITGVIMVLLSNISIRGE